MSRTPLSLAWWGLVFLALALSPVYHAQEKSEVKFISKFKVIVVSKLGNGSYDVYIDPKKTYQKYTLVTEGYNGSKVIESRYQVDADLKETNAAEKWGMRSFIDAHAYVYRDYYVFSGNSELVVYSNGRGHFLVVLTKVVK